MLARVEVYNTTGVQLLKSVVSTMRQVMKVGITDAELTRAKLVSSQTPL